MRTLTLGDVTAAARRILPLSPDEQPAEIRRLLDRAHAADLYRKRHRRMHPRWGNGSLMAAALAGAPLQSEPFPSDPSYLAALAAVIEGILAWRGRAEAADFGRASSSSGSNAYLL